MHSIALTIPSTQSTQPRALPISGRALLALVTLVIVGVYAMPIQQNWMVSAQDHYATSVDDMEAAAVSGNLTRQASFLLLGLLGIVGMMMSERSNLRISGWLGILCIAYVVWCGASVAWATEPSISVRRIAVMLCEALAAVAFARHVTPKQMVAITLACTLSWLGVGLLAELSLGTFHPTDGEYRFSGIFHPNEMGVQCSILIMAAVYLLPLVRPFQRPAIVAAIGVGTIFLLLTGSRTAIAVTVLCLTAGWLSVALAHRRYMRIVAFTWLVALMGLVFQSKLMSLLENTTAIGRADSDVASLTGRIPLWDELGTFIAERPWIGHGYGAFWTPDHIRAVSDRLTWSISSAHSSYVELALSVGYIGAVFCVLGFLVALGRSLQFESRAPRQGYAFIAMLLTCTLVSGLTETTFGIAGARPFFAMCAIALLTAKEGERPSDIDEEVDAEQRPSFLGSDVTDLTPALMES
jgi:O-antigen ligase